MDKEIRSDPNGDLDNLASNKTDYSLDITFSIVFGIAIIILTLTAIKSFRNKLN